MLPLSLLPDSFFSTYTSRFQYFSFLFHSPLSLSQTFALITHRILSLINLSFILLTISPLVIDTFSPPLTYVTLSPHQSINYLPPLSHLSLPTYSRNFHSTPSRSHSHHSTPLCHHILSPTLTHLYLSAISLSHSLTQLSRRFTPHSLTSLFLPLLNSFLSLDFGSRPSSYSLQTSSPFHTPHSTPTDISLKSFTNVVLLWYEIFMICCDISK